MPITNCISNQTTIDVNIDDFVFTPLTCAALINEIIKCLLYQKNQIPYPYIWLKTALNRKLTSTKKRDITIDNHYRIVSRTYENLENIMNNIKNEFENHIVKEVAIVFGSTPLTPKEVYLIKIDSLAKGHKEQNHLNENYKKQNKILREIFLSQNWVDTIDSSLTCTNTHIFLKKSNSTVNNESDNFFVPHKSPKISSNIKNTVINVHYKDDLQDNNCCDNMKIFQDCLLVTTPETNNFNTSIVNEDNSDYWCQANVTIRGYKDCFVNKISVSTLW